MRRFDDGAGSSPSAHKFVAGGEYRNARLAANLDLRGIHRGGKRDVTRRDHACRGFKTVSPALKSEPARRTCFPGVAVSLIRTRPAGKRLGVFLRDHGVGAVGQKRAGEDARRRAAHQREPRIVARADRTGDRELGAGCAPTSAATTA